MRLMLVSSPGNKARLMHTATQQESMLIEVTCKCGIQLPLRVAAKQTIMLFAVRDALMFIVFQLPKIKFHIRLNDNQDSEVSDSEELPVISKKLIFFVFGHAYSIIFYGSILKAIY